MARRREFVLLNPGDHVCAIYETEEELARIVAEFLAEGLRRGERCWYLPSADDADAVRTALAGGGIDSAAAVQRGALQMLSSTAAYSVRGDFDPEETMVIFSHAIEQAFADGFHGFRAAANMSWALALDEGVERLITYEALLRSLFSSTRATGLCLYDRTRMPLAVIDGALCTHPVVCVGDRYARNAFYDANVRSLGAADPSRVISRLDRLKAMGAESSHS